MFDRVRFSAARGPVRGRSRRWSAQALPGGVAGRLALVAALVAGCGTGPAVTPPPSSPTASPGATVAPVATMVAGSGAPAAVASPTVATPAERLSAALAALGSGYAFDAVVTTGDGALRRTSGRRIGDTAEVVVDAEGVSQAWREVGSRCWLRQEDGTWAEVTETPDLDPVVALSRPLAAAAAAAGGGLEVSYPASVLGLPGDAPTATIVRLHPDGTISMTWATTAPSGPATATMLLGPASGAPILEPVDPELS